MDKKRELAVIIPTYNEKENISSLVKCISGVFKDNRIKGKIIIVDDNSPDGTGEIADKLKKKYTVLVLHRTKDRGYGKSTLDGMRLALKLKFKKIITMDSDFSHNPDVLPIFFKELDSNEVVIGSRRIKGGKIVGWNMWRHFCSFGAGFFSRTLLGLKSKDITSGYRGYNLRAANFVLSKKIKSNGYSFLEEILYYLEKEKFIIKEIPITFIDRKEGKSKLSTLEIIRFFNTIIKLKFKK